MEWKHSNSTGRKFFSTMSSVPNHVFWNVVGKLVPRWMWYIWIWVVSSIVSLVTCCRVSDELLSSLSLRYTFLTLKNKIKFNGKSSINQLKLNSHSTGKLSVSRKSILNWNRFMKACFWYLTSKGWIPSVMEIRSKSTLIQKWSI